MKIELSEVTKERVVQALEVLMKREKVTDDKVSDWENKTLDHALAYWAWLVINDKY